MRELNSGLIAHQYAVLYVALTSSRAKEPNLKTQSSKCYWIESDLREKAREVGFPRYKLKKSVYIEIEWVNLKAPGVQARTGKIYSTTFKRDGTGRGVYVHRHRLEYAKRLGKETHRKIIENVYCLWEHERKKSNA